jgi:hypothetical protein
VILDALKEVRQIDKVLVDDEVTTALVTVEMRDVTVEAALKAAIDAAGGIDYVVSTSLDGSSVRLVAAKAAHGRQAGSRVAAALETSAKPIESTETPRLRKESEGSEESDELGKGDEDIVAPAGLNAALVEAVRAVPGATVLLPFPGGDGGPRSAVVLPPSATPHGGAATSTPPSLAATVDPELRSLYAALLTARSRER